LPSAIVQLLKGRCALFMRYLFMAYNGPNVKGLNLTLGPLFYALE